MRKLNTADVFAVARVIRASGMRDQLLPIIQKAAEETKAAEDKKAMDAILSRIGINGFLTVLEALAEQKSEAAIYEVLAGPMECSAEDVEKMPLEDLLPMLRQLAEENRLKDFFGYVSGILGKT